MLDVPRTGLIGAHADEAAWVGSQDASLRVHLKTNKAEPLQQFNAMDPLSIAASVIALITLTGQSISLAQKYIRGAAHARKAAASLVEQLELLRFSLATLDELLRSENAKRHLFNDTSVLTKSVYACQVRLNSLNERLNKSAESRVRWIIWPLDEKEHEQAVEELRTLTQWIQFALSIDGW